MEETPSAIRQPRFRHGSLFILVMGFLLGVLVTDLAIAPSRKSTSVRSSAGATAGSPGATMIGAGAASGAPATRGAPAAGATARRGTAPRRAPRRGAAA